ncbi:MAG: thiamine phosphate synthase [Candidatus Amulumruptor caecigallinarius]|nr:thiamine phosphate synthase [Candidatus Amulumruptor caecigallinarius]
MMDSDFHIIVITSPVSVPGEAAKIVDLLNTGVDFVHIRKPNRTLMDVRNLIEDIPYHLRRRLRLHDHFELLNEMTLAGAHLNSRCPEAPASALSLTRSCHTLKEVEESEGMEYVFLSPVYDSISKPGYKSAFAGELPAALLRQKRVVALGGVTPDKFPELRERGFRGAAMMGHVW